MRHIALLILVLALSACGTTNALNPDQISAPIQKGESRIVVSRDNSMLYLALPAHVEVNGQQIGSLGRGGAAMIDVRSGSTLIRVDTPTAPGEFVMNFNAKPGKVYSFVVSPDTSALAPTAAFGLIGAMAHGDGFFKLALVP